MRQPTVLLQATLEHFSFEEFIAFIKELVEKHNFWSIVFEPETGLHLFNRYQITHAAPNFDLNDPGGFIGQWVKNESTVRKIKFRFSGKNGRNPDIEMRVDLDHQTISLENAVGISLEQMQSVLQSSFSHISQILQGSTAQQSKNERDKYEMSEKKAKSRSTDIHVRKSKSNIASKRNEKNSGSTANRPSLFIASSVKGLDAAYAIQENLQYNAEVTVWPQGVFELSAYPLQSLTRALNNFDFGIFVFFPDDRLLLRKRNYPAVRDNVILELGLFIGKLGKDRTFIVIPNDEHELRIPTDIIGVIPGTYDARRRDKNLLAALGPFCNQVKRAMKSRGTLHRSNASGTPGRTQMPRHIKIHEALYGVEERRFDVRTRVIGELRKHGTVYIGNQLSGGDDPCHGILKNLLLDVSIQGRRQKFSIPEYAVLGFPEGSSGPSIRVLRHPTR
jgi:predicted nucleotide-binding protein